MNAGALRHVIVIEYVNGMTQDGSGFPRPVWQPFATVRAQISPLSGRELALQQAQTIGATGTHKVIIRYHSGLLITHRIRFGALVPLNWQNLTAAQWADLTAAQWATMTSCLAMPPRYFSINSIINEDERNRMITMMVTEYLPK